MHRLRIALKKLRYTAEFFAPLYPRGDVKRYLKKLRVLQNHLGELNDAANVRGQVALVLRESRERKDGDCQLGFAAGSVSAWYAAQTPKAIKKALKRYKRFKRIAPFWH